VGVARLFGLLLAAAPCLRVVSTASLTIGYAQSTPTGAAVVRVVPPSDSIATSKAQVDISININVQNVTDLAGFQLLSPWIPPSSSS
jgi:hypothetical protein